MVQLTMEILFWKAESWFLFETQFLKTWIAFKTELIQWIGSLITTLLTRSLTFYCDDVVAIDSSGKNITMIFGEYTSNANAMMLPKPDKIIFQNESFKSFKRSGFATDLDSVRFLKKIAAKLVIDISDRYQWAATSSNVTIIKFAPLELSLSCSHQQQCSW